jgi:translation initiation factor IF-3
VRNIIPRTEDDEPRINHEITSPQILLVDEKGVKVGQISTHEAIRMAEERTLDLVEVAPLAKPPVCRIMDYGKYRYQLQKKEKDARKKQKVQTMKEIKMRPKIDEHDYDYKSKAIRSFLEEGHRVKVSVFFRGREMSFLSKGEEVLRRVMAECDGLGKSDDAPRMEGRYMRITLTPVSQSRPSDSRSADSRPAAPRPERPKPAQQSAGKDAGVAEAAKGA